MEAGRHNTPLACLSWQHPPQITYCPRPTEQLVSFSTTKTHILSLSVDQTLSDRFAASGSSTDGPQHYGENQSGHGVGRRFAEAPLILAPNASCLTPLPFAYGSFNSAHAGTLKRALCPLMSSTHILKLLKRHDERVVIHFDYDCFYASVVEAENPALKTQPLAIQQKQIIVTCNYEARRRGLYKLQLVTEARKLCPDVIIVLGEDLTRFRNASKRLYNFLRSYSWNDRVERLGFDEVFMDVTDLLDYNMEVLNKNDLPNSFFQLSRSDPTSGFTFDASRYAGHTFPKTVTNGNPVDIEDRLSFRLAVGSHLALYLRHELENIEGYTSTVGISTSKLLSKVIGNLNKPKGQTTLLPPYEPDREHPGTPISFLDSLDIGRVPWIGFKLANKLREFVLGRPPEFDEELVYGGTRESVNVAAVREHATTTPQALEKLLAGPGSPHGIGEKIFRLINAIDDTEVAEALNVPRQISIEDSYIKLDTLDQVIQQMHQLSQKLIERMRLDLMEGSNENNDLRWIGRPSTIRLSTRPRLPLNADGTRTRSFKRISKSGPLPSFVFNMEDSAHQLAERLIHENLMPLFKKLHPERSGWNLSLVNVAVTDMVEAGTQSKQAIGRDIGSMFKNQDKFLEGFKVIEESEVEQVESPAQYPSLEVGPVTYSDTPHSETEELAPDDQSFDSGYACPLCGKSLPIFAQSAHERYHASND